MISVKSLDKFKQLYYTKFKIRLPDKEATEQATLFLELMKVLLQPQPNHN